MSKMNFDVAVVGSGLGGLTTALELARNGYKVAVFEQHRVAGGYAHSFKRKDFEIDVSLHHFGGLSDGKAIHGVLKTLGVLDRINYKLKKDIMTVRFPEEEEVIPNYPGAYKKFLIKKFPDQKANIIKLLDHLKQLRWHIVGGWIDPDFDIAPEDMLVNKYVDMTFLEMIREFVTDEKLIAYLSQFWMYIGLPPEYVNATFSTCVFNSHFMEDIYDIEGGGSALVSASVDQLRSLGSECFVRSKVKRILVEDGKAVGVELENGDVYKTDIVVSNADPYQTFNQLLDEDDTSKIFRFRLEKMERSISLLALYVGLDCPASELGVPEEMYFYNNDYNTTVGYERAMNEEFDKTDWCLTNYEHSKVCKFPKGCSVVSFVEVAPTSDWLDLDKDAYKEKKEKIRSILLEKYNKRFPGLKDHIEVMEFGTPRTMNRFSSNAGGSVYGLAQTVDQSASKRLRNITPVKDLYLTGSWTWSGGGYEGAIMSGVQTCASIIRQHSSKNNAPPIQVRMDAGRERKKNSFIKDVRVYNGDVSAGGIADLNCFMRFMDRGRVDSTESIFNLDPHESLFEHYNIQVYSISAKYSRDVIPGDYIKVVSDYHKRSDYRMVCHQKIAEAKRASMVLDALVELVQVDDDGALIEIPKEINDETPVAEVTDVNTKTFRLKRGEPLFTHEMEAYTEDSDLQGVVFHAAYLRYCEESLFEFIESVCGDSSVCSHWVFPEFYIRFMNSVHVGNRLIITVNADIVDGKLVVFQRVSMPDLNKIAVEISFELELRDKDNNVIDIPEKLKKLIKER